MAIFSSSVICATSSLARLSGASAVSVHGRFPTAAASVACRVEAGVAAGAVPNDASARMNPLTTLTVLSFIGAPFYDGLRRAAARRYAPPVMAAGEGTSPGPVDLWPGRWPHLMIRKKLEAIVTTGDRESPA